MVWQTRRLLWWLLLGSASTLTIPLNSPKKEGITSAARTGAGVQSDFHILTSFDEASADEKEKGACGNWKAWRDPQPPHTTLYVTGKCRFPTTGYTVKLRPVIPQGINPAVRILERIVDGPTGPVKKEITVVTVDYVEENSNCTSVEIRPDGVKVEVKVEGPPT